MNIFKGVFIAVLLILTGCQSDDPVAEIDQLIADKNYSQANQKYKELVDSGKADPAIQRRYIEFLYERKLFRDFAKRIKNYLAAFPNDTEVRNMQFEYYAKLANAAEQQGNYQDAMFYIVTHLLSPDYTDYRKWEARQTTVLRKWYQTAAEKNNEADKKKAITQMINLSFENLARTMDPDLYQALSSQAAEKNEP